MTHYGINPSFARHTGRLPLLGDFVRRGRAFEVFEDGRTPTGEASPVRSDGWPHLNDGRWHGVRIFSAMGGTMPEVVVTDAINGDYVNQAGGGHVDSAVIQRGRDSLWLCWKGRERRPQVHDARAAQVGGFHGPSLEAIRSFSPACVRTLDLQLANLPSTALSEVPRSAPLQATDAGMALEMQVALANLCGTVLWWTAPARYAATADEYRAWLRGRFRILRERCRRAPIVQYGNELWNDRLGPGAWLRRRADAEHRRVSDLAADEVALLREVGDEVMGPPDALGRPRWYLFVDGNRNDPAYMDRVLSALPSRTADLAGPAFYVGPTREDVEGWRSTSTVPTQDDLEASCRRGLLLASRRLREHVDVAQAHGVRFPAVYEAGQSMIAGGAPWRAAAIAAQGTEWMGDLYRSMRRELKASGVELVCWYSLATDQAPDDPSVDVFGLTAGLGVPEPPKARAARGE